jgi:hypothetical protein
MYFSASPRPTVVVVLPSPAGVGLIAVTSIGGSRRKVEAIARNRVARPRALKKRP